MKLIRTLCIIECVFFGAATDVLGGRVEWILGLINGLLIGLIWAAAEWLNDRIPKRRQIITQEQLRNLTGLEFQEWQMRILREVWKDQ